MLLLAFEGVTILFEGYPNYSDGVKGILLFSAAGIMGPFLGRVFSISAIKLIGGTRTSTLRMGETFITLLLAFIIFNERIRIVSLFGAILLISGIVFLINEKNSNKVAPDKGKIKRGFIFSFISAFFFAAGRIFHKLGLNSVPDPILGALCGTAAALLVNGVFIAFTRVLAGNISKNSKEVQIEKRKDWVALLFFVFSGFSNSMGLLFLLLSLNTGGLVSLAVALKNTSPLFTLLLSWIFLKNIERISKRLIMSIGFVLAGALIIITV